MNNLVLQTIRAIVNKMSNTRFSYIDEVFDIKNDGVISRWILLLPGTGCIWAKEHGGCHMCGFKYKIEQVSKGRASSHGHLMKVYRLGQFMISDTSPKNLTIYNGGSFLNDEEIPSQTQLKICRQVYKHPTIQKLFVESRPEFVTESKVGSLISTLGGKTLEIGIGLECVSDEIRAKCIHKGFSRKDFEEAVRVLKENKAKLLTYVFLKPIYLTEAEAIQEAINTIAYAFKAGSDEVALEAAFIQKGTMMEKLYSRGRYKPPWLWSIIQVIKSTHHLGPVSIGGFEDEPLPINIPHNCQKCSPKIMDLFEEYKRTHNIRLFKGLGCECKTVWEKELTKAQKRSLV